MTLLALITSQNRPLIERLLRKNSSSIANRSSHTRPSCSQLTGALEDSQQINSENSITRIMKGGLYRCLLLVSSCHMALVLRSREVCCQGTESCKHILGVKWTSHTALWLFVSNLHSWCQFHQHRHKEVRSFKLFIVANVYYVDHPYTSLVT